MTLSMKKLALLSLSAFATLSLAPAVSGHLPAASTILDMSAEAKDAGHDSDGGHDSGDHDSSDHDSGDHDSGDHDSGGSEGHESGDDSGHDSTGDQSGSTSDDSPSHDQNDDSTGRQNDRDGRVTVSVSDDALKGLQDGRLKAVDEQGRTLEVEVETEHGKTTVEVKRHGEDGTGAPISAVSIVPAT